MSHQIVKQPNGKYCLWSSITDTIIYCQMDKNDIVNYFTERARKEFEKDVKNITDLLEEGKKPYHQFTKSYEECLELVKEIHGEEEVSNIRSHVES